MSRKLKSIVGKKRSVGKRGEENAMNRFLVVAGRVAVALACQAAHAAESAPENCFVANAKAEARNAKVAADKALKLLRHHIADQHLIVPGGKKIGPTSVHCVLSSCEASATVCHHL
jgi:hypothetical protein